MATAQSSSVTAADKAAARAAATRARLGRTSLASIYAHYVTKAERKGRTQAEVDQVLCWLTGLDQQQLQAHLDAETTYDELFEQVEFNPDASLITGTVCGVRVEDIQDPFMQKLRYMDKLVDEVAKGKAMEKILRA